MIAHLSCSLTIGLSLIPIQLLSVPLDGTRASGKSNMEVMFASVPPVSKACFLLSQVTFLVGQSVVLGYLTEYFSIQDPTAEDTRDAYLLAASKLFCSRFHSLVVPPHEL